MHYVRINKQRIFLILKIVCKVKGNLWSLARKREGKNEGGRERGREGGEEKERETEKEEEKKEKEILPISVFLFTEQPQYVMCVHIHSYICT